MLLLHRSSSGGQKQSDREREREKSIGTRGTTSAPEHTHSQPGSHLTGIPRQKPFMPVHPVVDAVVPLQPVADALDEDTICRKTGTIIDELAQNKDFKVRISPVAWIAGRYTCHCILVFPVYQVNEILKKMSRLIFVTLSCRSEVPHKLWE